MDKEIEGLDIKDEDIEDIEAILRDINLDEDSDNVDEPDQIPEASTETEVSNAEEEDDLDDDLDIDDDKSVDSEQHVNETKTERNRRLRLERKERRRLAEIERDAQIESLRLQNSEQSQYLQQLTQYIKEQSQNANNFQTTQKQQMLDTLKYQLASKKQEHDYAASTLDTDKQFKASQEYYAINAEINRLERELSGTTTPQPNQHSYGQSQQYSHNSVSQEDINQQIVLNKLKTLMDKPEHNWLNKEFETSYSAGPDGQRVKNIYDDLIRKYGQRYLLNDKFYEILESSVKLNVPHRYNKNVPKTKNNPGISGGVTGMNKTQETTGQDLYKGLTKTHIQEIREAIGMMQKKGFCKTKKDMISFVKDYKKGLK